MSGFPTWKFNTSLDQEEDSVPLNMMFEKPNSVGRSSRNHIRTQQRTSSPVAR
jgi:hypothetical protein